MKSRRHQQEAILDQVERRLGLDSGWFLNGLADLLKVAGPAG